MQERSKPFSIFSTRTLPDAFSEKLTRSGLRLRQKDFIKVNYTFNSESFATQINNPNTQARVFTSKNAVYSLQKLLEEEALEFDKKKNFTVGVKATEMLSELGIETSARATHALALAQIIARNPDVEAVDYFCGNKALDDLPEYLESKGVAVHKEEVYQTELVMHEVETATIDGIIFLSPTAVFSFFKKNKLNPNVPCFCIGATTSEAIHLRCDNVRIPSNEPVLESVVNKVIEYFEKREAVK